MITAQEIFNNLNGQLTAARGFCPSDVYTSVAVDSRRVAPGAIFVALPGEHHDGHDFVDDAVARGAAALLVKRDSTNGRATTVYEVAEPLAALQRLATARLAVSSVQVIGITGSVGKTTCKELTAAVLSARYSVLKSEANLNSEIGLPISILGLRDEHERAVLEMAMYQSGDIRFLCELARPQIGVVTNVGVSHIERLGSQQAIADAKAELPESLPADGYAVLNADDPFVFAMAERTRAGVVTYGVITGDCALRADEIVSRGIEGVSFVIRQGRRRASVHLAMPGRHNVYNALAAAAVGLVDGLSLREVADALSEARPESRIRMVPGCNGSHLIDDTYNASPSSMIAAIDLLKEMPGKTIAFLGDMRELGSYSYEGHRQVGQRAAQVADVIYAVGEDGKFIGQGAKEIGHPMVRIFADKDEAAAALRERLRPGDYVLIKASRGMALETVVEFLKA